MATYGFKPVGTRDGQPMAVETFTVGSVVLKQYDLVKFHTDGTLLVAVTRDTAVVGVILTANDSDGHLNVGSSVQVVTSPNLLVFADSDGAACTVGTSYSISGGTGAQQVDVSDTGDYNMYCVQVDPYGTDASTGIFEIKNTGTSV